MENISVFCQAALPWIVPGLTFAVLLARSLKKEKTGDYGMEGMCLGLAIGCSFARSPGMGLSIGLLVGLAIGSCMKKEKETE